MFSRVYCVWCRAHRLSPSDSGKTWFVPMPFANGNREFPHNPYVAAPCDMFARDTTHTYIHAVLSYLFSLSYVCMSVCLEVSENILVLNAQWCYGCVSVSGVLRIVFQCIVKFNLLWPCWNMTVLIPHKCSMLYIKWRGLNGRNHCT